jgi:hypothetical protein
MARLHCLNETLNPSYFRIFEAESLIFESTNVRLLIYPNKFIEDANPI